MKSFAALVLAAGLSSRVEEFKPLLSVGGKTFVDRLIWIFLDNNVEVYVVAGHRADELKRAIKERKVTIVKNPDYEQGMFRSIQAGVHALSSEHKAFFVMPVDIPLVRAVTIRQLMATFLQNPGRIIYPVFNQKRGHPPLIPVGLAPTITNWQKDGNLREVLNAYEQFSLEVSVFDCNILLDIDTDDDYRILVESFQSRK